MTYVKFETCAELGKFLLNKVTTVEPELLLHLIAPKYLRANATNSPIEAVQRSALLTGWEQQ